MDWHDENKIKGEIDCDLGSVEFFNYTATNMPARFYRASEQLAAVPGLEAAQALGRSRMSLTWLACFVGFVELWLKVTSHGQFESERCTSPKPVARGGQLATHFLGGYRAAVQAEAVAIFASGKSVTENPSDIFFSDANTVVAHRDFDAPFLLADTNG